MSSVSVSKSNSYLPFDMKSSLLLHYFFQNGTIMESDFVELSNYMKKESKLKTVCDMTKIKERSSDGRCYIYINRHQIVAATYPKLIDKLYDIYFGQETLTMEQIFPDWMIWRRDTTKVKNKTLKENLFLWNSLYKDTQIAKKPIVSLTAQDFSIFFRMMTKDGTITRKRFNDGKSVLNSIYDYVIEIGLVPLNPIKSLSCKKLNFKPVNNNLNVYTLEERKKLLDFLSTKDDDIYALAIQLNFNLIARIGELKDFMWCDINDRYIRIQGQLLEEQTMNDDLTFNKRTHHHVDYVKGRTSDGFRNIPLTPKAREIIEKIKQRNPDGEFMLMCDGKPLTTVTFNRYLKAYCKEAGVTYRSSHKIRFCVASAMYAKGVEATKLQKLLGHSTLAMTLKYFKDITPENDCYASMVDILDY